MGALPARPIVTWEPLLKAPNGRQQGIINMPSMIIARGDIHCSIDGEDMGSAERYNIIAASDSVGKTCDYCAVLADVYICKPMFEKGLCLKRCLSWYSACCFKAE